MASAGSLSVTIISRMHKRWIFQKYRELIGGFLAWGVGDIQIYSFWYMVSVEGMRNDVFKKQERLL